MATRTGVEIARVGTYPLSSGEHTFTRAQLAAAVRNHQAGHKARIGIGHTDPRWNAIDASADGEPAVGDVRKLRLAEDGDVLLGDYEDMPDWFAQALDHAYRGRSLEGSCEGDDLRIDAVKVLGTTRPAIHTLADLETFVTEGPAALMASGADNTGRQITVLIAAASTSPSGDPMAASRPDTKEHRMTESEFIASMRERFGLADDASHEDVLAKYDEQLEELTKPAEETTKVDEEEKVALAASADEAKRLYAAAQKQVETLSKEVADLQAKETAREEQETTMRRDQLVASAVAVGKITKHEAENIYRPNADLNEDRVREMLDGMAAGRVPVAAKAVHVADLDGKSEADRLLDISRARAGYTTTKAEAA